MVRDTRQVSGAQRLGQRIATIRARLNLPVLSNEIGELLLNRTLRRFDAGLDPDGRVWEPLADNTLASKRRMGFERQGILKRTLKLRNAIQLIRGDITGAMFFNTGAGVRLGVLDEEQVIKARVHQRGNKHIPQRRIFGIGPLDIKSVDSFLRRRGQQVIDES
jgi:hypothetical protein